jgi:hypothetical protein
MLREVSDRVACEGGSLLVGKMRVGQSGSVHIHDTLLNALTGALFDPLLSTNPVSTCRTRTLGKSQA